MWKVWGMRLVWRVYSWSTKRTERRCGISAASCNIPADVPLRSSVIRIYFDAKEPALAQDVLRSLVTHYLRKHIEIHRSAGAYDFLSQQTDQVRARLAETEEELRRIKNEAGIVSVEDAKRSLLTRMAELVRELQEAEGTLAASDAKWNMLHPLMPSNRDVAASTLSETNDSAQYVRGYEKLARLQDREMQLQVTFTDDSIPVQNIRAQIDEIEKSLGSFLTVGKELGGVMYSTNLDISSIVPLPTLPQM